MTADEIRNTLLSEEDPDFMQAAFLREIAAQLAEFNAMVREAMDAEKQP